MCLIVGKRIHVEHPAIAIKRQFGFIKFLYHGIVKNTAWHKTLFVRPTSFWTARQMF